MENNILKEEVREMSATNHIMIIKENELIEFYDIEKITVHALQEYLNQVEKDCNNALKEGNRKLQQLKEERRQLRINKCHR